VRVDGIARRVIGRYRLRSDRGVGTGALDHDLLR
jgi:hypothetical protein